MHPDRGILQNRHRACNILLVGNIISYLTVLKFSINDKLRNENKVKIKYTSIIRKPSSVDQFFKVISF